MNAQIPQEFLDKETELSQSLARLSRRMSSMVDADLKITQPLWVLEDKIRNGIKSNIELRKSKNSDAKVWDVLDGIEKDRQEIEGIIALVVNLLHDFSAFWTGTSALDLSMVFSELIDKTSDINTYLWANIWGIENGDIDELQDFETQFAAFGHDLEELYIKGKTILEQLWLTDAEKGGVTNIADKKVVIFEQVNTACRDILDNFEKNIQPLDPTLSLSEEVIKIGKEIRNTLQQILASANTQGVIPELDKIAPLAS